MERMKLSDVSAKLVFASLRLCVFAKTRGLTDAQTHLRVDAIERETGFEPATLSLEG